MDHGSKSPNGGRRLQKDLREELRVAPEIRIENFGTLERTTFKAKWIVDKRK